MHREDYQIIYLERDVVNKTVAELLASNIIRPSQSPYASPIVLVKKKNGEIRMCIDYRALNKLTIRDNFPSPLIEDCLEYLESKKVFSVLDLKSGFHQTGMDPESVKYTAFITPDGHYEYLRMHFGLKNGPAVFQLHEMIRNRQVYVYMDDIILATCTVEEHLVLLSKLLDRLNENRLEINYKKSVFLKNRIDYLGYNVCTNGILPNETHLKAIREYPDPLNCKSLHYSHTSVSLFRQFHVLLNRCLICLKMEVRSRWENWKWKLLLA